MRRPTLTKVLAATALLGASTPAAAMAATPSASPETTTSSTAEPWVPYHEDLLTLPAGRYCTFEVTADPVFQHIRSRVLDRYPDGAIREQEFAGPLISLFTNTSTGELRLLNLSGHATAWYYPNGDYQKYETRGPVGFGFRAGDAFPQAYYQLRGHHVITFDADGTRHMAVDQGRDVNLCTVLSRP